MKRYMNTKELSRYLGINEKKIYTLITEKRLPATKITGKWIFLKDLVDTWIENSIENYPGTMTLLKDVLMIAGSNEPLLEMVINELKPGRDFFPFFCTSGRFLWRCNYHEDKKNIRMFLCFFSVVMPVDFSCAGRRKAQDGYYYFYGKLRTPLCVFATF